MEKLNICFFGDAAARHLLRWSRYFSPAGKGHRVQVITFNPLVLEGFEPVKVEVIRKMFPGSALPSRLASLIPMIAGIRKQVRAIRPDVIHCHSAGGYAWMTALSGFHPFIITPWGDDVLLTVRESALERFLTVFALKRADLITCDGENIKQAMIDLGVPGDKIRFITFGVDIKKFAPSSSKKERRPELSLPESNIVISTRTLNPVHNVETLIRSIPLVLAQVPDTFFVIVGGGTEKDNLTRLAGSLGILPRIKFTGPVSETEMISFLQAADTYVSTSISESGLAASTAEAMACELPVINTDTGDIRLWIKDGSEGFVIPVKAPEVLADRIIRLVSDPTLRNIFGKAGRLSIEERNNYYKEMDKMEQIYYQARRA